MPEKRSHSTRSKATTTPSVLAQLAALSRRTEILEEESLRRNVARDEALRKDNPDLWRTLEIARRTRNQEKAAINRRLRAEGLRLVEPELSLAQRVKKLQRLEARNKSESAKSRKRS